MPTAPVAVDVSDAVLAAVTARLIVPVAVDERLIVCAAVAASEKVPVAELLRAAVKTADPETELPPPYRATCAP